MQAVKVAESRLIQEAQAGHVCLDDAAIALTALATHTVLALDGGEQCRMGINDLLMIRGMIANFYDYIPSSRFPFTKKQLRRAWRAPKCKWQ